MKNLISLLIGCSLALAGVALAQQPEEQPSPKGKKGAAEKTTRGAQATPGAKGAKPEATVGKQTGAMKERGAPTEPGPGKGRKGRAKSETAAQPGTNVPGQPAASAAPGAEQPKKGMKGRAAKTSATPAATAAAAVKATPAASAAPSVSTAGQTTAQTGTAATTKKVEPQKVQQVKAQAAQIKQQHATFRAQPRPDRVPAVTYNQNYRIQGSDQWQGPQYDVFRSYRPERHDQGWYRSRYNRVELIGGGYYYWNNGYWYPAWGYNPSAEYYAYDSPIYVGHRAEPPDKVIADVQAVLQQ